ncbi:CRISPR-associated endonuclease Cas1 [Caminibacter mediatlanticus]|uniref:CRISPR-associated endonuclease Cas1 n=1 Tax=Caminibacter mediatlanticus TaxID=291048 RepID=UPI001585D57C|nr:CRISPR-associated endonuclease Cas1 [Caminibacter mediatlanticus]
MEISEEKSYFSDIYKGFSFLGCFFRNNDVYIDKEKLYFHIESVKELQNKELNHFLKKIENKIDGLARYYEKVITSNQDIEYLKGIIKEFIIDRLSNELKNKSKKELKEKLKNLNLKIFDYNRLIDIAYEKNKYETIPKEKIEKQQKIVFKNKIKSSVIVIEEFGTSLGVSKNTLVIKKRGKIAKKLPLSHIEKIIIQAKGVSISSNLIYALQKRKISIEFIDYKYNPYAMIYGIELSYPKIAIKQLEIVNSEKRIEFAREFVKAKIVNQRNYLKIMSKYHKNLEENIIKIDKIKSKIKNANKIDELMGYEGSIANIYWNGISKILNEEDFKRITKGATDRINTALNYGYAILYNKVQKALIKAGLGINISFLHAFEKKPVLVFDFIEQFRCVAVDKAICFSLKKSDDIDVNNKGMLTKEAKRRIIEEVNERLATFYKFNGKKYTLNAIIEFQAIRLRDAILNSIKYKSFIARY